ncbi:hypothetical protein ACFSCZ_09395 [Siminovitchia sediminis]|uniref:Uncharacterized protein n=1 Tax=Siminovitchia sediminis TaxID=1274353 RepID=A0ABW4KID0_9BACI
MPGAVTGQVKIHNRFAILLNGNDMSEAPLAASLFPVKRGADKEELHGS